MGRRLSLVVATLVGTILLGVGCGADIPTNPTWAHDVWPILRARCIHCHYAMDPDAPLTPDSDAENFDYPDFAAVPSRVVDDLRTAGVSDVQLGTMPKPPAAPLADWQIETLVRWSKSPQ